MTQVKIQTAHACVWSDEHLVTLQAKQLMLGSM